MTKKVKAGDNASVSIKTRKDARCSIDVEYDSGPSMASGLGPKRADSAGSITWTWMVGLNTRQGSYPIEVFCKAGERQAYKGTQFTVR